MGRPRPINLRRPLARSAGLAVLGAALVLPASASAGSAGTVIQRAKGFEVGAFAYFTAGDGERNRLGVTADKLEPSAGSPPQQRWTFKDTGAPITASDGCTQVDASTVTCLVSFPSPPSVALGDGDDEMTSDTLVGVDAGPGDDTVRLLAPNDQNSGGSIRGGAGDDLLDASLTGRVTLQGGGGGDLLLGSEADDDLDGGAGIDELRGGKGDDVLAGDDGADRLTCGDGTDRAELDLTDRLLDPDTPTLGLHLLGRRTQTPDDGAGRASLKTDCEQLALPAGGIRTVQLDLGAPGAAFDGSTIVLGRRVGARRSYDVQLRDTAGKLLASGSLKNKTVRVRLTRAGIKALEPGSRKTVRLLTRPRGAKTAGSKSRPGVQVDITVPKADES